MAETKTAAGAAAVADLPSIPEHDMQLANLERQHEARASKPKEKKATKSKKSDGWSLDKIEFPTCILSIGKSKRGKSYLTRYLLDYFCVRKPVFKAGIVFVGTKGLNNDWDMMPDKAVITGYSEEKLKMWLAKLMQIKKSGKEIHTFIVFDDLLGKLEKSSYFDNFLSTYRHYNVSVFLNNQYLASSSSGTLLREQTEYLFAFRTAAKRTITCLYDWFGQLFDSEKEFKKTFMEQTAEDHTAMLFIEGEEDVHENYLAFTAPGPDEFKPVKLVF